MAGVKGRERAHSSMVKESRGLCVAAHRNGNRLSSSSSKPRSKNTGQCHTRHHGVQQLAGRNSAEHKQAAYTPYYVCNVQDNVDRVETRELMIEAAAGCGAPPRSRAARWWRRRRRAPAWRGRRGGCRRRRRSGAPRGWSRTAARRPAMSLRNE